MTLSKKYLHFLNLEYSSYDLSIFRILFYISVLIIGININISDFFGASQIFLFPVQHNDLYLFIISNSNHYYILKSIFFISIILSMIGYGGRWPRFITFTTFMLIISSYTMYGIRSHRYCGIVFYLLAICCFDSSRHYSLDSYLLSKKNLKVMPTDANTEFLLLQTYFFWMFFDAGLSKLIVGGGAWATVSHIKETINFFIFGPEEFFWYDLQVIIRDYFLGHSQLLSGLGTLVMIVELLAPLGLIFTAFTMPLVLFYLIMLVGFLSVMWLNFLVPMIPVFLIWLPYKKIKACGDSVLFRYTQT